MLKILPNLWKSRKCWKSPKNLRKIFENSERFWKSLNPVHSQPSHLASSFSPSSFGVKFSVMFMFFKFYFLSWYAADFNYWKWRIARKTCRIFWRLLCATISCVKHLLNIAKNQQICLFIVKKFRSKPKKVLIFAAKNRHSRRQFSLFLHKNVENMSN